MHLLFEGYFWIKKFTWLHMVSLFEKICDRIGNVIGLHFSKTNSDANKISIRADGEAKNIVASTQNGSATVIETAHIHIGGHQEGNRRKAIRELKKAAEVISWAIEQSKNPLVKNKPGEYQKKLKHAFEEHYTSLSRDDVCILEKHVSEVTNNRIGFEEMTILTEKLHEVLDSLQ